MECVTLDVVAAGVMFSSWIPLRVYEISYEDTAGEVGQQAFIKPI